MSEQGQTPADVKAITAALTAPFDVREVKFKPQSVKGNRALAIAYVNSRVVQDRLDAVLGVEGWQDEYTLVPDGSVVCKLSLNLGGRWVTKMDVGSPSEQPDGGDRLKAAFSDALKRAAVKFGLGRYLYRLPPQWCDYDSVKKEFTRTPQLPAFAIPKASGQAASGDQPPPAPKNKPAGSTSKEPPKPYESVADMRERVANLDAYVAAEKKSQPGLLIAWLNRCGKQAGYATDEEWNDPSALAFALDVVQHYVSAVMADARQVPDAVRTADDRAETLQKVLDATGRRHFGYKWEEWLAEQGVPDPAALGRYNFRSLDRFLSELNTQMAYEKAEADAIQGDGR